jgi:hypothetical protein
MPATFGLVAAAASVDSHRRASCRRLCVRNEADGRVAERIERAQHLLRVGLAKDMLDNGYGGGGGGKTC